MRINIIHKKKKKKKMNIFTTVFKFELNHNIIPGVVTVGKYDGTHICLTAASGLDKVIIHSPHSGSLGGRTQRSSAHGEVSELNLSQPIHALAAGQLKPDVQRDVLLIGSPSQILAYDVHDNTDLFYKEAPDGVNVIIVGNFGKYSEVIAIIGGNSSLQGLNSEGIELFWNVVSGKVCSMILFDYDRDGENEVIVGSDDSFIRIYKNDHLMLELSETGPITCLARISEVRFAYGIANGTIGVYEEGIRLWRLKSKQAAISLAWTSGALAACWERGRIDWRDSTGRVVQRAHLRAPPAALLAADYRATGTGDLLCVSQQGEVVGYAPFEEGASGSGVSSSINKKTAPSEEERAAITDLFTRKQALMVELRHYEANVAAGSMSMDSFERPAGSLAANTRLQVALAANSDERHVELSISTNNDTVVRAALVLAEGMFSGEGETITKHPSEEELTSCLLISMKPPRDVPLDIHVKALVGYPDSEQFHVFELTKQLPRFSMYAHIARHTEKEEDMGFVTFGITERIERICIWINQNFLLPEDIEIGADEEKKLNISLLNMREGTLVHLDFESDGQVRFSTIDMGVAGDLVQSLSTFLNLEDLQTTANFPKAEKDLMEQMTHAARLAEVRSMLAATTAERAQSVTALLPAAQDAYSYSLKEMMSRYNELVLLNEELIGGCHARRANQNEATPALKFIHKLLQQASRLRVGKYSKAVVAACRNAVQQDNVEALVKIIRVGDA